MFTLVTECSQLFATRIAAVWSFTLTPLYTIHFYFSSYSSRLDTKDVRNSVVSTFVCNGVGVERGDTRVMVNRICDDKTNADNTDRSRGVGSVVGTHGISAPLVPKKVETTEL